MNFIKHYDEFNIYGNSVSVEDVFKFIGDSFDNNPEISKEELLEKAVFKFEWDIAVEEITEIVSEAFRNDHTNISE